jgi:signal transduction histidine kinase
VPGRTVSISLRLTAWFGAIFLAGWLLFGGAMWFVLKGTLNSERKQTLMRRADRLQDLLRKDAVKENADRYKDFSRFSSATGNGLMEVFYEDGRRVWPSPSAAAASFAWPAPSRGAGERFVHVSSDGQPYWVIERAFDFDGRVVVLLAAAPEAANLVLLSNFWRGVLAAAPVLLLISMAGGYWTSRRALRPVDRITATARSIGIRNLSERVPVTRSGDELERLADTCNEMLGRLEIAVRTLKQFTADASHELRGPLSLTRTIAEVALRGRELDDVSRAAFVEIVEESAKATTMLEGMLDLARADIEPVDMVMETVDLAGIVDEGCARARGLAAQREISVTKHCDGAESRILGHAASLRRLLWILLDNALKYTPEHGEVSVSVRRTASAVLLEVSDNGIGIAPEDMPHVFDRFYRVDPSRGVVEGNGLGLSIAKWIADVHRAEIRLDSEVERGSRFTIFFTV